MEHLSNDHEDHPNQHKTNQKLCDETRHPILSLTEISMEAETATEFSRDKSHAKGSISSI